MNQVSVWSSTKRTGFFESNLSMFSTKHDVNSFSTNEKHNPEHSILKQMSRNKTITHSCSEQVHN